MTLRVYQNVKKRLIRSMKKTSKCKKILVNLAINYGSKDEIIRAANRIKKTKGEVTIKNFEKSCSQALIIQIF